MFNQRNIGTVSRATLGRLLRDGAERVWAFSSDTMPSSAETERFVEDSRRAWLSTKALFYTPILGKALLSSLIVSFIQNQCFLLFVIIFFFFFHSSKPSSRIGSFSSETALDLQVAFQKPTNSSAGKIAHMELLPSKFRRRISLANSAGTIHVYGII